VLVIRHRGGRGLDAARALLEAAVEIADAAPTRQPLVADEITS
jgi:hypothetical protein